MVSAFFSTRASASLTTATATAATMAIAALLVWTAPLPAHAQAAPAAVPAVVPAATAGQDFPADAHMLSASEMDARLRGKVYTATLASGVRWRADYKASGYVFVNMSNNGKDSGLWRTEDGKVCVDYRGRFRSGCTEMRGGAQQTLYAKNRSTGEVVALTPE